MTAGGQLSGVESDGQPDGAETGEQIVGDVGGVNQLWLYVVEEKNCSKTNKRSQALCSN